MMRKHKKILMVLGLILVAAALVWAAAELSGQANQVAQDAGGNSADMEMVSLRTIKKPAKTKTSPKPPNCDWRKERNLNRDIETKNAQYKKLVAKAKSESANSGEVTPATANAIRANASQFNALCVQYAAMWDKCNCTTRANLARETGQTRIKSADVVASKVDRTKLAAMNESQEKMRVARREYAFKAADGGEISARDKADLSKKIVPQVKGLLANLNGFLQRATRFLKDVQKSISGGGSNGGGGGGGSDGRPPALIPPAKLELSRQAEDMVTVGRRMVSNVNNLQVDVQSLISGTLPPAAEAIVSGLGLQTPCFIESAFE